jgi:hypothetical protein
MVFCFVFKCLGWFYLGGLNKVGSQDMDWDWDHLGVGSPQWDKCAKDRTITRGLAEAGKCKSVAAVIEYQ